MREKERDLYERKSGYTLLHCAVPQFHTLTLFPTQTPTSMQLISMAKIHYNVIWT